MAQYSSKRLSIQDYYNGILHGDRIILAKAITLIESSLISDYELANKLVTKIMHYTGKSIRIGITGVPGSGKSTFIEALGKLLVAQKKKVAVLTVDPSSKITKGSILGDKTRMEALSASPLAFIRPSPSGDSAGGIARKTRETILLCEAAGYEIILIETVGVGQSETRVHGMVDFFLLLLLTGGGDELQAMKKGIMEMADALVINKSDQKNMAKANALKKEMELALHILNKNQRIPVLTCSALEEKGIKEVWEEVKTYVKDAKRKNKFAEKRKVQNLNYLQESLTEMLMNDFYNTPLIQKELKKTEQAILEDKISPASASEKLFKIFKKNN